MQSHQRHRPSLGLRVVLGAAMLLGPAWGQDPAAEAALQQWEKVRQGPEQGRFAVLSRLGRIDDPAVTAALLAEVGTAQGGYLDAVIRAIGARPRPDAVRPLGEIVLADATPLYTRRNAASAIAAAGNLGIDWLLWALGEGSGKTTPPVRDACLQGLGASKDDRALRALATMALEGSPAQQLEVLRLLGGVRDVPAVTRARELLAGSKDDLLAATAVRQLGEERHGKADLLAAAVADRAGVDPPPAVRAELVQGLCALGASGAFPLLLRLAASEADAVRKACREAAAVVAKDPALIEYLCLQGLNATLPIERQAALRLLREAPPATVRPLVDKVRERLKRPNKADLDLAIGLHEVLAKDPSWKEQVLALARSSDAAIKTVGLDLLRELGAAEGVELAWRSVDHKQWEIRSAAYRLLAEVRDVGSIAVLIPRVEKETGRLEQELNEALFRLTGRRFWQRSAWENWWRQNKAGHALPALASVTNSGATGSSGGGTASYFDIPLVSKRTAFVLDVSGSMAAKIGTDGKRTRLDEAKRQLARAVQDMAEDHFCNLVVYETRIRPVWDRLHPAKAKDKAELQAAIEGLRPTGGTNIHDALEEAFRDPDVDTIYLLTDGQPSAGAITDPNELADEVRRWNRVRQIVIHCVAVGMDSALLKRLAAESGGQYRFVR